MASEESRLVSVETTTGKFVLKLKWSNGHAQTANLTGLISRSKHFQVFMEDPDAFDRVSVINWGHGVEWENGLDYAAENLAMIASEQEPWTAKKFVFWQKNLNLSNTEAADALGYKLAQIKNFRSGKAHIPVTVSTTCRTLARDKTRFFAHFQPSKPAGRPKRKATA